jgi:hypothetical protein
MPFPIGVMDLSLQAKERVDDLLGSVKPTPPQKILLEKGLMTSLQKRGTNIWNGNTYSLHSLKLDSKGKASQVNAYVGSFFDMVSSAGYLELECLSALREFQTEISIDHLPARKRVLEGFNTPGECLRSGGGVDAVIAVSTLVVYQRKGKLWVLWDVLPKRKKRHKGLTHAVPSLIFKPVTGTSKESLEGEWSITHNIFREYLEELFHYPEAHEQDDKLNPDYFYTHPNLIFLQKFLKNGSAILKGTGVVFNLLNHRPEICTLLLIQDEEWYERQTHPSKARKKGVKPLYIEQDLSKQPIQESLHSQFLATLPLDNPQWGEILKPWGVVPPGGAALILGAKEVVKMMELPEPGWLRQYFVDQFSK